jgi:hypothetical protein
MVKPTLVLTALIACLSTIAIAGLSGNDSSGATVLIRCDDLGMCHTVNMAAREVFDQGFPVSVSVMFACPWYQEAVEILKQYPHVSVGVHLTLNAEWKNYRWGPVTGRSAVPSLVDSVGYFFPSRAAFFANKPELVEVERELRAQIARALDAGIRIDYLDYHMGTAVDTPEMRVIVEQLAREYRLAVSRYFGEVDVSGVYNASTSNKLDSLKHKMNTLSPLFVNLLVFHIGLQTPEMDALIDLNKFGLPEMSKHREAELRALLSPDFQNLIKAKKLRLTTYRELIESHGLDAMKRPQGQN